MYLCLHVLRCLVCILISAGIHSEKHFPKFNNKILRKGVDLFKVNNEDTRGMSIFLNVSMSMRSIWWIQLYLNFFQHYLSIIYFIWYTARYMMRQTCVPPNITRCTKLRGTQCHKKYTFVGGGSIYYGK